MLQLFIFIFLDIYAFSTADLDDITINKISRTLDVEGTIQTTVTFAEITENIASIDHYHISVISGGTQDQDQSIGKDATFAVFPRNIKSLESTEVTFIITGQNDEDVDTHWGQVKLTLPDFLGADADIGSWVGKMDDDVSLRINPMENIFGYELGENDGITCQGEASKSCYFVGATMDVLTPIQLCKKVDDDTKADKITVCDETLIITKDHIGGAIPTSAKLTYPKTGKNAQIIIVPADQEVVVYKEDLTVVKVCYTSTCEIGKHNPSTETSKVLVVGLASAEPANSEVIEIKDYELVGTALSVDLMETRWIRSASENSYKVSRTHNENDTGSSFEETMVTCNDDGESENFHCFAYFVGLAAESSYDLTVEKGPADLMNIVTLKATKTPSARGGKGKSLKLSSLDTKWHKGLRSFEVNICVHNDDASNLSSYQAILMNKHGQWKKIEEVTHKIGNKLCFDALHMDIHSFDLSENLSLVVVKRGHDGITVLRSTETVISVEGNQSFIAK